MLPLSPTLTVMFDMRVILSDLLCRLVRCLECLFIGTELRETLHKFWPGCRVFAC